ncbi:MAG: hypothetical protein C5B49_09470 [Bdellovibrio sp.]|nr:MAG: hypothetical protein C5B49_09470 [Bdellovibrio sp.]
MITPFLLSRTLGVTLALLLALPIRIFATTIVQEREAKLERFLIPERLTFGPEDTYQGSRQPQRHRILYTHKAHLAPSVQLLDLNQRVQKDLGSRFRDSESPAVSPDESRILFRRLSVRAEGEICWVKEVDGTPECLASPEGEKTSPFWLGSGEIGYLRRPRNSDERELRIANLATRQDQVFHLGSIVEPQGSPQGNEVLFVGGSELVLWNRQTQKECRAGLAWPGAMAFPRFDQSGEFIVFSLHLADSNEDGKIDIKDRAVIGKVPRSALCGGQALQPEVLTSLQYNCSHPRLSKVLDMTCAYEGSLDLYQAPAEGLVPAHWKEQELLRAVDAARTPEERLFGLWTMQKRAPQALSQLMSRIWVQFLIMRDDVAAKSWLELAQAELKMPNSERQLWEQMFAVGILRKSEPPGALTLSLRQQLEQQLQKVRRSPASLLRRLVEVRIHWLLGDTNHLQQAQKELLQAVKESASSYPQILLAALEWEDLQTPTLPELSLQEFLVHNLPVSSPEALPLWVRSLERLEVRPLAERRQVIQHMIDRLSAGKTGAVSKLLQMELLALNVSEGQANAYLNFDREFSKLRNDARGSAEVPKAPTWLFAAHAPQLLRAVGYRAIHLWTQADRLQEIQYVTTNLLKYIPSPSFEWTAARDYFITSNFDRAYETEGQNKPIAALGHFYGSLTLTDDLEAHWGYLRNMVSAGRAAQLKPQLDALVSSHFIEKNEPRVRIMSELAQKSVGGAALTEAQIDDFLTRLQATDGGSHPMALFLDAELRLEKLLMKPWGSTSEQVEESDKIHRNLILALDGSLDNRRLTAAIQQNMALLYSHTTQWGAAQRAWTQRLKYPFTNSADEGVARWFQAQSLFHLGEYSQALNALSSVTAIPAAWRGALEHRRAFYATLAGDAATAKAAAEKAVEHSPQLSEHNGQTALFLLAHAKWALKMNDQAFADFAKLWRALQDKGGEKLPQTPSAFHPRRLQILTTGYLAQLAPSTELKKLWNERRLQALGTSMEEAKSLGLASDAFFEDRLKSLLAAWENGRALSPEDLQRFFADLDSYRNEAGVVASVPWFESLHGLMLLDLMGPEKLTRESKDEVYRRIDLFMASANKTPYPSPLLNSQVLRLRSTRYASERGGRLAPTDKDFYNGLLTSDLMKKLRGESPALGQRTEDWLAFLATRM